MMPEGTEEEKTENSVFYKMHSLFRTLPELQREVHICSGYERQPDVVSDCSDFESDIEEIENSDKSCSCQTYFRFEKNAGEKIMLDFLQGSFNEFVVSLL